VKQADANERALLRGLRVLVVEDQFLIADELDQILTGWRCKVFGPAPSAAHALEIIESQALDCAILDINLGDDERSFSVAEALVERDIPFLFLTGYISDNAFLPEHREVPRYAKPLRGAVLAAALAQFARARAPDSATSRLTPGTRSGG
jgi:CheY-like chemotaxis protein